MVGVLASKVRSSINLEIAHTNFIGLSDKVTLTENF